MDGRIVSVLQVGLYDLAGDPSQHPANSRARGTCRPCVLRFDRFGQFFNANPGSSYRCEHLNRIGLLFRKSNIALSERIVVSADGRS